MNFKPLKLLKALDGHKSTSAFSSTPKRIDKDDDWEYLQDKFKQILDGADTRTMEYDTLYRRAYTMILDKRGNELYDGVRKIIINHVKRLLKELQSTPNRGDEALFVDRVDRLWYNFSGIMEKFRSIMLYSERVYERSIDGESIVNFGWRIFRLELLENGGIKTRLPLKLMQNPSNQATELKLLRIMQDGGKQLAPFNASPLVSVDILIDILAFLDTLNVGLKAALVSRQLVPLAEYTLGKRKHRLAPVMICDGYEEAIDPFAVPLIKRDGRNVEKRRMSRVLDEWSAALEPTNRIVLPKIAPPKWITGVELIYLSDGMNRDILTFLYSLREKLQNCELVFNFSTLWIRLHENKLFWTFLNLFNECCFSLTHADLPLLSCSGCFVNENKLLAIQWPLWALFNNIFFTGCRHLTLPLDFLNSLHNGVEAAKWLQHESTEQRPRKLKLYTGGGNLTNWQLALRGVSSMLEKLREDFANLPDGGKRRTFFVELPCDGLHYRDWGQWQNAIGEQLVVNQHNIKRTALADAAKQFDYFYAHLTAAAATDEANEQTSQPPPKVMISAYRWVKKTVTPGTPVAVRRSSNSNNQPPTPAGPRRRFIAAGNPN